MEYLDIKGNINYLVKNSEFLYKMSPEECFFVIYSERGEKSEDR